VLTSPIHELAERVSAIDAGHGEHGTAPLEVNDVVSAVAGTYEKLRYLVEYREEHTVRRAAIERILRRRLIIEGRQFDGSRFMRELVEGRYLAAHEATEHFAHEASATVARFEELATYVGDAYRRTLLSLAASEIEALVTPFQAGLDVSVIDAMYKTIRPNLMATGYSSREIDTQLFCACRRALLGSDDESLAYALWLAYVPTWKADNINLRETATAVPGILTAIKRDVAHHLQWIIVPRIKREAISFRILRSYLLEHPHANLTDERAMSDYARHFLDRVYEVESERIKESGIRAVAYLFVTKFIIALIAEAPYEYFVLNGLNYVPLITNLVFHPTLLFTLTRGVGSFTARNTETIIADLHRILYDGTARAIVARSSSGGLTAIFAFFYALLIVGVFGGIVGILQALKFNIVGGALFLLFLSLAMFFAYRIRMRARRWVVIEERGVPALLTTVLVAPIVRVGRYLSRTFSSINVFVLLMDFIIETPLKMVLNFSHHFLIYLREKANEVY